MNPLSIKTDGSRVAIVTGGSKGIGEQTVKLLVSEGWRVAFGDIAEAEGRKLEQELNSDGEKVFFIKTDVRNLPEIKRLIESTVERYGYLDGLVNNAGIVVTKSTVELTEDEWDLSLNVNLKSIWAGCKYAIPYLANREGAAIVNVASNGGLVGFPNLAAYCASKGGVINFTRACALDCASLGIRVNAVAPGHTRTPMGTSFIQSQADPVAFEIEHVNLKHPLGRMAEPQEVASVISFLLGPNSSFITGSVITADGGYTAA